MKEKIVVSNMAILKAIRRVLSGGDDNEYETYRQLMRATVYIATKNDGKDTSIIMLPKCTCDGCSYVRELIKQYAQGKMEKEELINHLELNEVENHMKI